MRSILTFGIVGGGVTALHVAVGLFVHHVFGLSAFTANLVAYTVGFFASYFGHRHLTFRSEAEIRRSMPKFLVISANSLVLNQVIVYVGVNMLGGPYWASLAVMVTLIPIFTYVLSRIWAFSDGDFG